MLINFYSINGNLEKNDYTMTITGFSQYINKYFHIKIKKCRDMTLVIDEPSDEYNIIVKSNRSFYKISTNYWDKFIKANTCLNFDYNKYNIPVNVYISLMGLISVRL